MPKYLGTPYGAIVAAEAAGNSATLSACNVLRPIYDEFTNSSGTFEFTKDIYIWGIMAWGDAANLTGLSLQDSEFASGRYIWYAADDLPAETSTASAHGWHDLRNRPLKIPKGDIPEVNWSEDASTNVEPHLVLYYSLENPSKFGSMYQVNHLPDPGSCMTVTLAHSGTTAVTWTVSTNIMGPNNNNTRPFLEHARYVICAHRSNGAATYTAGALTFGGAQDRGLPVVSYSTGPGVDSNVNAIPEFDPNMYCPIECTGAELNAARYYAVDVAGSETPSGVFDIRRVA